MMVRSVLIAGAGVTAGTGVTAAGTGVTTAGAGVTAAGTGDSATACGAARFSAARSWPMDGDASSPAAVAAMTSPYEKLGRDGCGTTPENLSCMDLTEGLQGGDGRLLAALQSERREMSSTQKP